jgi:hypothetical protein
VQRITVPACIACNNQWSNDEAHFRNVLLLSGNKTSVVQELWEGKTRRSFGYVDGRKRLGDLVNQLVPVLTDSGPRHMIYPGRDDRVMKIVRKVIRGLCHHHGLLSPVLDSQVWADIQQFEVPEEFLADCTAVHAERDILEYRYALLNEVGLHSFWILKFFGRTPFYGSVNQTTDARGDKN